jgi:hypothetical protein
VSRSGQTMKKSEKARKNGSNENAECKMQNAKLP